MMRSTLSIPLLSFILASVVSAGTGRAEDSVLVTSTEARYVPGTVITDDQTLSLPRNASVSVLFRSGEMLRLNGPFEGPLAKARPAAASGGVTALVAALRGEGIDATALGASRSVAPSARRAMVEQRVIVDPRRSAIYCLGGKDTVWLRRPAQSAGTTILRRGKNRREVSWPEGASQIEWPIDLPIEDSDRFDVLDPTGTPSATLIFRRMSAPASDTAWIAESLILGCRDQAEPALLELQQSLGHQAGQGH